MRCERLLAAIRAIFYKSSRPCKLTFHFCSPSFCKSDGVVYIRGTARGILFWLLEF